MTITVFGATGMVGKQLVREALIMGHKVRAFGRNVFTAGFPKNENLHVVPGALFDEDQVFNAIKGSDAVISVVGGSIDGMDKTRSLGMKNIVQQMERAEVKRIIALGGMGVLDSTDGLLMEDPAYPREYLEVGKEHFAAFQHLANSSLDFTFIGAPEISDGPPTGLFRTAVNTLPEQNQNRIHSGDLALFMLQELNNGNFLRQRVGISN